MAGTLKTNPPSMDRDTLLSISPVRIGFGLEKRRLWRDIRAPFQYVKGAKRELERDFYKGMK